MPKAVRLLSGPWKAVSTTPEPFDMPPDVLDNAKNGYLADTPEATGFYARPGFTLLNGMDPVYAPAVPFRGQAVYCHEMLDGSRLNFLVIGGKLFRAVDGLGGFTDVTPLGVTIDSSITTRVFFCSLLDNLICNDEVNRPWIGTDLTSTPITGTYIDYDGLGVSWTAYGNPAVYLGAVFFILNEVNGVSRRADVSCSEPGLPAVGYQQSGSDNNMTLSTSDSGPLFALSATNVALNYFREHSIGAIAGSDIGNLISSATEDAIAFNVGTLAAQTLVQYGNAIYFGDSVGRPSVWTPGNPPNDIWKQFRSVVQVSNVAYPTVTAIVATATLEPTLNKYITAIWSPSPATQGPPTKMYVWDAPTQTYNGYWEIEQEGEAIGVECLGVFYDSAGRPTLIVLAEGGFVWGFTALSSEPQWLTTEDDVILTTEDGVILTTEGVTAIWNDNGEVPDIFVKTANLGESDGVLLHVDTVTVSTLNPGPVRVTTLASMTPSEVEGEPSPSSSQDGTYRLVVGADAVGRGPSVIVKPLTATDQFILQRITIRAIPEIAGSEDS